MAWYSVHVEARGEPAAVPDDALDQLMELLIDYHGSAGADDCSWDVTLSVEASTLVDAGPIAQDVVLRVADKAGFPEWPVVRIEVVHEDVLTEELERPALPPLVSGPEAAEILGVSRQRLHQLAMTSRFPQPLYELGAGKLWHRAAIERFAETSTRKPGRPTMSATRTLTVGGTPRAAGAANLQATSTLTVGGRARPVEDVDLDGSTSQDATRD